MSTIHDPALYQLRHALRGHLYDPGEPEYEDACTLFNGMIETRPRHVARCSHPHQVAAALAARVRDLRVAVRGGGHSVAGLSLVEDGLVIDVRGLSEVVVDPVRRIVRVGGGATWAEVDRATQEHGLAAVGGRVSSTGVAGLTLGGGSGWLERKHGLACDNLVAVELITASGEPIRASADEHPELFWALRGGGGNFGVVTALELRLHEVGPEILGGLVLYPRSQARETLRRFRDFMVDAGGDLAGLRVPDRARRGRHPGRAARAARRGDRRHARRGARRRRGRAGPDPRSAALDAFEPTTYADFQSSLDDPPGYRNWWTAEFLDDIDDAAIDAMVALAEELPAGPAQIFIPAWGGAVARGAEAADRPRRASSCTRCCCGRTPPTTRATSPTAAAGARPSPRTGPARPTSTSSAKRARTASAPPARTTSGSRVKARWDPDNVFQATGNVRATD